MMRILKNFLETLGGPGERLSLEEKQHTLQLATAVLLIEVMRADPEIDPGEQAAVVSTLQSKFRLEQDELAGLLELAGQTARDANDFYSFTSTINAHFSHDEKIRVVENMWQVAYADSHLGAHENHVIGKVAGLLHVTHGEYIAAKLHAKSGAGT